MTTQATITAPARPIPLEESQVGYRQLGSRFACPIAATTPAGMPVRERSPYWDNARFAAIFLVIVGHATLKLISASDVAYSLYLFVYVFQVPAFVLVSGYFAKATPPGVPQLKRLFTDLVVPYLIFETLWSGIHFCISGHLKLDYTTAWWTLWFLLALCIWRVVLPYLVILRYPLLISVALSVGAGYLSSFDDTFSLSRAVALLPFFVLGWKLRQWNIADRWLSLRAGIVWRWRAGAIALFVGLAVVAAVGIVEWRHLLLRRFLLYDESYASFGYAEWWAGALRLGFIGLGALCCFALLALMPRGKTWFSGLGTRTMYIYLLHSLILYPIRQSGLLNGTTSVLVLVGMVALSFGIAVVLGLPIVKRIFRPVVEPKLSWLFRHSQQDNRDAVQAT
ncbi:MAG TPA: acyltransferase family protein [Galbitalea sp.]|nr:acyltransferase family protein [Galbitalea sp.]